MDNFEWLEEEKKQHKFHVPAWLREYWLHITALAVIFIVLVFLIFNPASKSVTHEKSTTTLTNSGQGENKQILIRMPDKTTKLASTAEPNSPELNQAPSRMTPATSTPQAPSLAPAESFDAESFDNDPTKSAPATNPLEPRLPVKQIGIINPNKTTAKSATNNSTKSTEPSSSTTNKASTTSNNTTVTAPNAATTTTLKKTTSTNAPAVPTLAPANEASAAETNATASSNANTSAATSSTAKTTPPAEVVNVPPENADLGVLLKLPASHYILQLFGSHSESAAKSFIAQHNLAGKALYAKVWQNNQDWYVVLYGDYSDRHQATAAIHQLSPNLQTQKPWARSVQSVQDAIRQRLVRGE